MFAGRRAHALACVQDIDLCDLTSFAVQVMYAAKAWHPMTDQRERRRDRRRPPVRGVGQRLPATR